MIRLYKIMPLDILLSMLEEHEKEGAVYIAGIIVLIASILILASLTHVVLNP